jgi:hypothetical protein
MRIRSFFAALTYLVVFSLSLEAFAETRALSFSWTNKEQLEKTLEHAGEKLPGLEDRGYEIDQGLIDYIFKKQRKSPADLKAGEGLYVSRNHFSSAQYGDQLMIIELVSDDGFELPSKSGKADDADLETVFYSYGGNGWAVIGRALNESEMLHHKLLIRTPKRSDVDLYWTQLFAKTEEGARTRRLLSLFGETARIINKKKIKKAKSKTDRFIYALAFDKALTEFLKLESIDRNLLNYTGTMGSLYDYLNEVEAALKIADVSKDLRLAFRAKLVELQIDLKSRPRYTRVCEDAFKSDQF